MARYKCLFKRAYSLNRARVPAWALVLQGLWAAFLVLPRTYNVATKEYGNLYSNLLDYVISAALIFYILTVSGTFPPARHASGRRARPYRAFGYPVIPALYIWARPWYWWCCSRTSRRAPGPGVVIVLIGVPVYWLFKRSNAPSTH